VLTTPELIRLNLDRVFLALEDMVQVELIRTRWKEIKSLQQATTSTSQSFSLQNLQTA